MGKSTAKQPSEAATLPTMELPDAAHDPSAEVAASLVGSNTDPFVLGMILRNNPRHQTTLVAYLSQRHGMAFVATVLTYVAAANDKFGEPTSDQALASGSERLASGKGATSTAVSKTPDPGQRLPYDDHGGWASVQINLHLGQHDRLVGTDSDGERCSFAVALAAQIFAGPSGCARWLIEFVNSHQAGGKVAPADAGAVSLRRQSAARMVASIADAIGSGTATYGDLSWAQEALHAYTTVDDHAGSAGGAAVVASTLENYQALNSVAETGADVMARASALTEGAQLTLVLVGVYGDDRADYVHQLSIMKHDGQLYLYDPEWPTGDHLDLATAARLSKYVDKRVFASASFLIQGMVWPKAAAATAPKSAAP